MKIFRFSILLCIISACAIVLCGGTINKEKEYILQEAKVYQSPMVVPKIKAQAAEPESTMGQVKPGTESSKDVTNLSAPKNESGQFSAIITHYCACASCNGKWSYTENGLNCTKTASGIVLYDGISGNYCAATFGSLGDTILINGTEYIIADRMGGNDGYRIDIFVAGGHDRCNELGRYTAEVTLKG